MDPDLKLQNSDSFYFDNYISSNSRASANGAMILLLEMRLIVIIMMLLICQC